MKNTILLIASAFIFLISGCSTVLPVEQPEKELKNLESDYIVEEMFIFNEDYPVNDIGNTLGGGAFFAYNNYIFGTQYAGKGTTSSPLNKINWESNFAYVITDEDKSVDNKSYLLEPNPVKNICVFQDKIYYIDEIFPDWINGYNFSKGQINVMNLDGTESKALTDKPVRMLYIYNSYIYYLIVEGEFTEKYNYSEGVTPISEIYRMELDGSNNTLIHEVEGDIKSFSICYGKIYYSNKQEFNIYEYDLNTKKIINYRDYFDYSDIQNSFDIFVKEREDRNFEEIFNTSKPNRIIRKGDHIYFLVSTFLFRIDRAKMELVNLSEIFYDENEYSNYIYEYLLDDEWIYYSSSIGLTKRKINDLSFSVFMTHYENIEIKIRGLQLVNDDIYFTRDRWNQIEKMPVDGDETQVVYIEYGG